MPALDQRTLDEVIARVPPARGEAMRRAFATFAEIGLPSSSDESWRYVDLDLDVGSLDLALEPGEPLPPGPFLGSLGERGATALVADGHLVHADPGEVQMLDAADLPGGDGLADLVPATHDLFAAARSAFGVGGLSLRIERNQVVERPVVVDVQATGATASFPVLSVEAGPNSEASIVFVYRSPDEASALLAPLVALRLEDGARLRFLGVQVLGTGTTAVVHQRAVVGRDASLRLGEVGLGAAFGRLDLEVLLEGAGASGEVVGLSFGEHEQTLDYRMVMRHRGPSTTSDVFLKGAVEDEAEFVFTGLLAIEKDAVRSSAFETNRNLVLSEGAKAHSVPNLEILCNDVVCGHGSSVGPLEEEHLYYLQSRGLSRQRAERLLVKGFFQEVIDRLPVRGLEAPLQAEVFRRFTEAQEEGRVA